MEKRKEVTTYQYPYPAEPRNWSDDERLYGRGLRRLFDILFSRKVQNVLIADKAVNARVIEDGAVQIRHLQEDLGAELDISGNPSVVGLAMSVSDAQQTADNAVSAAAAAQDTADQAVQDAAAAQDTADQAVQDAAAAQGTADQAVQDAAVAQQTADSLTNKLMPVGITIIASSAPSWGIWVQTAVDSKTAWTRTA